MIEYGIESGNQDLLNYIRKGISMEQVRKAIRFTKKYGIKTFGFFMLALPKETPEMGKKTVKFAIDLDLDSAQFVTLRPLHGTEIYEQCQKEGTILDFSDEFYDKSSPFRFWLFPTIKFIPDDYLNKGNVIKILKFAYRKFYFRYPYICKVVKNIKNFKDLVDIVDGFWLFIRILFFY